VPAVEVTITYLEMEHPAMLRAVRSSRDRVSLERIDPPSPKVATRFYADVGNAYYWLDRAEWSEAQWRDDLSHPGTELWVLRLDGSDAGFFVLTMPAPRIREILFLGLLPGCEGSGLGAHLLTCAVERAWEAGADRVIVNTCTLDHPRALPNYLARGFEVVRKRTEWRELPKG
jgi:ribosomal protein S18 acetylase RimI-like enzyme